MADKKKILIIDDEPDIIEFCQMALEANGYEVLSALSGESGLEIIASTPPDLILLDIMMPGMDGFEVCKRLKGSDDTKDIPVFMVSAKALELDLQRGHEVGCDDYVVKPFEMKALLEKICSNLN